jgi:voltage-gated potassium channel
MYFIASGDVAVDLPGRVFNLGAGHFFGELALLERTPRQATVTTMSECQLLRLDGADFRELMAKEPDLHAEIMKTAEDRRRHGLPPVSEETDSAG